jgi:putative transferase (TIGR04331 family)
MINSKTFVALTSNQEFWRNTDDIVALGTWCIINEIDSSKFKFVIPHPISSNKSNFLDFKLYVDDLYIKKLETLAKYLNNQHQTEHTVRYWEILIGPFLHRYITIMYERYLTISNLIYNFKDFDTFVMDPESFHKDGYSDTLSYISKVRFEDHNLEIYSKLLTFFGKDFDQKKIERYAPNRLEPKKQFLKLSVEVLLNSVSFFKFKKKKILMKNSYFDTKSILKFVFLSKFSIRFKFKNHTINNTAIFNKSKRNILRNNLKSDNHFEKFLKEVLPTDLPMCFLENYKHTIKLSKKIYPSRNPEIIFSANAWYYDEIFKVWSAENIGKSKLVGSQHGGNYGVVEYLFEEEYEKRITDHYISWGWGNKTKTFHPIGSNKLWNYKKTKKNNANDILYSMTIKPKFFFDLRRLPEESLVYLKDQKDFLNSISDEVLNQIRIRPYNSESKHEIIKLWQGFNKDIVVEDWDLKFISSLKNCKLCIVDHIMTSYLEPLKMNIPTMIYINSNYPNGVIRKEVKADFQKLEDVGILYYSMKEMAINLNEIYANIDDWWNEKKLQQVRQDFCEKFAFSSNFMIRDWDNVFMEAITDD